MRMMRTKCLFWVHKGIITRVHEYAFLPKFYAGQNYVKSVKRQLKTKESGQLQQHSHARGKYLVFVDQLSCIVVNKEERGKLRWISHDELLRLGLKAEEDAVFLNSEYDDWKFAVAVTSVPKETKADFESQLNGKIISFRTSLFTLSLPESAIASQALALLKWNKEFNFCSTCSQKLLPVAAKTLKKCVSCSKSHYPAVNPVGITLVKTWDNSKVLLVRQHVHPPGMYTCIAGFVETGETIEENVRREIAEEVGIPVMDIKYFGSQHWAFPINSLMIGCTAVAENEMLSIDHEELEDARWFTPDEVRIAAQYVRQKNKEVLYKSTGLWIPPPGALAHSLITHWLQAHYS